MSRTLRQILIVAVPMTFVVTSLYVLRHRSQPPVYPAKSPKEIEILEQGAVRAGDNSFDYYAEVLNLNSDIGARGVAKLFSGNDVLKSQAFFIAPGERKYLIFQDLGSSLYQSYLKLERIEFLKAKIQNPDFVIRQKAVQQGIMPVYSEIAGVLVNNSLYNFKETDVNALIKDESNKVIAVNKIQISDLRSGEERGFKMPWYFFIPENVKDIIIQAETDVFNENNIF